MVEWTTEKEFNRPNSSKEEQGTTQKDGTVNVQINIAKLTDRLRRIYEAIKNSTANVQVNVQINVQVNVPNLAALLNVSEKTIRRDLYVLRDMNLIQYVGSDKTEHWEIVCHTYNKKTVKKAE